MDCDEKMSLYSCIFVLESEDMQEMFKVDISPKEYQAKGKDFDFPDLTGKLCPNCGKQHLRKHGFYTRYLIDEGFEGYIIIRRYICPCCGTTVSLLPWFCHPRRTYSMELIHYCLSEFAGWKGSIALFLKAFADSCGIEISRQLLYQFRKRIYRNLNRIIMHITAQFRLTDPVTVSEDKRKRVKDALSLIETAAPTPLSVSMDMFSHGLSTYLTL